MKLGDGIREAVKTRNPALAFRLTAWLRARGFTWRDTLQFVRDLTGCEAATWAELVHDGEAIR